MCPFGMALDLFETHPLQGFFDGHFLRVDKTSHGDLDCQVYVVTTDIFPQRHFGTGLGHANNALQVPNGDGE